jgi:ATPase subunit of ABC transporter with duplicated ATPase domains
VPAFVLTHLGFAWPDGDVVFDDLDLTFPDGLTGLVGRNGEGKTTLLRILTGDLVPTSGQVVDRPVIGYLPQQLTLDVRRPVAELLGVADRLHRCAGPRRGGDSRRPGPAGRPLGPAERITATLGDLGLADVDLDARVGVLSGGQVVLTALAGLFLARPDALILDEPTNNLDRQARELLITAIRRSSGPVIVVSHDRELLDLVDQVVELRAGTARLHAATCPASRPHWPWSRRPPRGRSGRQSRTYAGSSASWPRPGCGWTGGSATPAARPTTCPRSSPGR